MGITDLMSIKTIIKECHNSMPTNLVTNEMDQFLQRHNLSKVCQEHKLFTREIDVLIGSYLVKKFNQ